jgi:arylsulfatase
MTRTLLYALAVSIPAAGAPRARAAEKPNVVLIVADDLGCFELGCYGQTKIKTPHIDKLAAGGARFTRFYAGCAVCAPSRCALMTGRHMGHARVRDNRQYKKGEEGQWPIRADDVTVTELLKARGYATGAMGKWGLGNWDTAGSPMKHGFDLFFGYNCQAHAHSHYPKHIYRDGERIELKDNDGKTGKQYTHDLFEAEALDFVTKNKDKPFFLYLPFTVPHVALQVPEDSLAEYKGKLGDDPPYDGKKLGYLPHDTPRAAYAAMVTRMDRSVGRLMEKLKELKLDTNTLVLFTSDNGPTHPSGGAGLDNGFSSAGTLRGLKGSLYEGGIRVPLVAYMPGTVKPGAVFAEPLYFPDVLPTLCEFAGATAPDHLDGIGFLPLLTGRKQTSHDFLYWEFPSYGGQQAVIEGEWKAVRQNLSKGVIKTELYHLATDESEKADVAAKHPAVLARLEKRLQDEHTFNPDFPLPAIDPKK